MANEIGSREKKAQQNMFGYLQLSYESVMAEISQLAAVACRVTMGTTEENSAGANFTGI